MTAPVDPEHQVINDDAELFIRPGLEGLFNVRGSVRISEHLLNATDEAVVGDHPPWAQVNDPVLERPIPNAALVEERLSTREGDEDCGFVFWVGR